MTVSVTSPCVTRPVNAWEMTQRPESTEGGRQGIALPALMAMTGHRFVASAIGYFQTGGVADNPVARLLESHEGSR